ncbi:MAG: hypothetical protein MJ106_06060, partial [Lentisphaeria bacterium]|nr:hypothetical protein [Lentisphaeria bacterium]
MAGIKPRWAPINSAARAAGRTYLLGGTKRTTKADAAQIVIRVGSFSFRLFCSHPLLYVWSNSLYF